MRELTRWLAWDAVLVHVTSLVLFTGVHVLVFFYARDKFWIIFAFLAPVYVIAVIGWAIQAQILFRGTAELRRRGGP